VARDNKSKNPKLRLLNGGGPRPIPIIINCPECGARHIDEGEWATRVHHTHSCQECGMTWRPAVVPTVGVQFLPGFKNKE
jgi:rubredoxin